MKTITVPDTDVINLENRFGLYRNYGPNCLPLAYSCTEKSVTLGKLLTCYPGDEIHASEDEYYVGPLRAILALNEYIKIEDVQEHRIILKKFVISSENSYRGEEKIELALPEGYVPEYCRKQLASETE